MAKARTTGKKLKTKRRVQPERNIKVLKEMDALLSKKKKKLLEKEVKKPPKETKISKKKKKVKREKAEAKVKKNLEKLQGELGDLAKQPDLGEGDGEGGEIILSTFSKDFEELRAKVSPDNDQLRPDQMSAQFSRAALSMILQLLPIAEHNYRLTKKDQAAYVISSLVNQARDLNNDVKMSEDLHGQAVEIARLTDATFTRVADLLLQERYALQTRLKAFIHPSKKASVDKEIDALITSVSKACDGLKGILNLQVSGYIHGDPNYINPTATVQSSSPPPPKKTARKRTSS